MSITYLNGLQYTAFRDRNWHLPIIASITALAEAESWAPLLVDTNEHPSTSLVVTIAAGSYVKADGTLGSYAGGTFTCTASTTVYLWLTDAGVLTSGTGWPAASAGGDIVRLAVVVAGTTSITSITPARVLQRSAGGLRNANTFHAGPSTGPAAAPTWRALAGADLPVFVASGASHAPGGVPDPGSSAGTTRFLREDATWAVPSGTVSSVGLSAPGIFTVSGSPVTSSGTLTLALATQNANVVFAGPSSGGAAAPTFRALVAADLPTTGLTINSSSGTITADTDGATITFDCGASNKHSVTLGGNRTLALTGDVTGQEITLLLTQDATGSRTVTWWSGIRWPGGTAPTLTTTASKTDAFRFLKTGTGAYLAFILGQNL